MSEVASVRLGLWPTAVEEQNRHNQWKSWLEPYKAPISAFVVKVLLLEELRLSAIFYSSVITFLWLICFSKIRLLGVFCLGIVAAATLDVYLREHVQQLITKVLRPSRTAQDAKFDAMVHVISHTHNSILYCWRLLRTLRQKQPALYHMVVSAICLIGFLVGRTIKGKYLIFYSGLITLFTPLAVHLLPLSDVFSLFGAFVLQPVNKWLLSQLDTTSTPSSTSVASSSSTSSSLRPSSSSLDVSDTSAPLPGRSTPSPPPPYSDDEKDSEVKPSGSLVSESSGSAVVAADTDDQVVPSENRQSDEESHNGDLGESYVMLSADKPADDAESEQPQQ